MNIYFLFVEVSEGNFTVLQLLNKSVGSFLLGAFVELKLGLLGSKVVEWLKLVAQHVYFIEKGHFVFT